jgi:hypothetical protein
MKTYSKFIVAILVAVFFSSCEKDNEPDDRFTGTLDEIEEFFTPELVQVMTDMGLAINTGNTPPIIEGNYLAEPILMATNVSGDVIGQKFFDAAMKFENQNNTDLSLTFSYDQTVEKGNGIGALIAGTENSFSAFLKVDVSHGPDYATAQSAMVISGKMTTSGITDFQWALFMLDNKGESTYIENNTGRVFKEVDNIAKKTLSAPSGRLIPGSGNIKSAAQQ